MRNVLLLTLALALAAAGTTMATGSKHEVGGTAAVGNLQPFNATAAAMRFQCMWLQPEINEQGTLARVEFKFQAYVGTAPGTFEGCKMILCHTAKTTLTNNFKTNYDFKTPVEVFSGNFTVPAGLKKNDWFTVATPSNFTYNNRNNLLMEISWTKATGASGKFWISSAAQPGRLRAYNATAATGRLLAGQGEVARITFGNPAVSATSLGKVKALLN